MAPYTAKFPTFPERGSIEAVGVGVVKLVAPGHRSSATYYSPTTKIAAISFGVAQYCEAGSV